MSAQDEELIYLIEHFWSPMHWRLRGAVIKRVTAMQQENATLRARVAELEARYDSGKRYAAGTRGLRIRAAGDAGIILREYITDGFGSYWLKNCPNCGALMQVVRPGEARCSAECDIKDVLDANT